MFLAFLNNEPERADICDQLFENVSRDPNQKLLTSTHSLVEVAFIESERTEWVLSDDTEERMDALWSDTNLLENEEYSEIIARGARTLIRWATIRYIEP